ncbi:diphthamide biosynthesis protein 2 [Tremella mesenterica]|uniref:2-(3-amino-3-carboxypropyl)histidine synthase subunit 2 n=1 Tax=Tremella mesenterica TaxID=5217 RepID=A0A4Q1BPA9_TREME|nr:diphthamide biosynthesis protein 2 [Tremella mesenterica]
MSVAFSTPAEHAFVDEDSTQPPVRSTTTPSAVALQFPDELLYASVAVFRAIQTAIQGKAQAYVLGDSTHGSCCPDVLSCLHLPADLLVHYGHACLTPTDALPVFYVFPRQHLDVIQAAERLIATSRRESQERKGTIVVWDVSFDWLAESIVQVFTTRMSGPVSFSFIQKPVFDTERVSSRRTGKAPALRLIEPPPGTPREECVIFYIGQEGRSLVNLQMTNADCSVLAYSPTSGSANLVSPAASKLLSRRLYAVHRAMAADVFGLVVSNIGLAASPCVLDQLRRDLKTARKKSYTMSVGRLNPAKLANFAPIDCFVLIGCNEGGVVESKDYMAPIVTPWELRLALSGAKEWTPSNWTTDLSTILQRNQNDLSLDLEADDQPQFSLINGEYRTPKMIDTDKHSGHREDLENNEVALRISNLSIATTHPTGSQYLASRQYKGLDPRYGLDEPASLEEGLQGIARGYNGERSAF